MCMDYPNFLCVDARTAVSFVRSQLSHVATYDSVWINNDFSV